MQEYQVKSLRDIEDIMAGTPLGPNNCFRGQASADWSLVPSAYRSLVHLSQQAGFDTTFVDERERDTYRAFDISARGGLALHGHILERLSVAQHHGVPTRLLDWTHNLTVAAYFAVFGGNYGDSAIWALSLSRFPFPKELGRQHRGGGFLLAKIDHYGGGVIASFALPVSLPVVACPSSNQSPPQQKIPTPASTFVVWKPEHVDERLSTQDGLLSWYHSFGDDEFVWDYAEHIRNIDISNKQEFLIKFVMRADMRQSIRDEVLKRGYDEFKLFPDLDGLGRMLSRQHHESMSDYTTVRSP